MHAGIPLTCYFFLSLGSQAMGWYCSRPGGGRWFPLQLNVYQSPSQAHPEGYLLGDSKSSQADNDQLSHLPQVRDGTRL